MSTTTFDSHLAQYISQNTNSQTKAIIREELQKLLKEQFPPLDALTLASMPQGSPGLPGAGGSGGFTGLVNNNANNRSLLKRLWEAVKGAFKKIGKKIPSGLKQRFFSSGPKVAADIAQQGGRIATWTGRAARLAGMAWTSVTTFFSWLGGILAAGGAAAIATAVIGAITIGAVVMAIILYFDDGVGGIAKATLEGAGLDSSEQAEELNQLMKKAFVKKKESSFFDFDLSSDGDDYSAIRAMRGKSKKEIFAAMKRRLSKSEYERAVELDKEIGNIQRNRRFEQAYARLKDQNKSLSPKQIGALAGATAVSDQYGGEVDSKKPKPKPKPKPGGRGSKAARQRALSKKIGMSVRDIQKKLMNYFKKGSNTFSLEENKGAGLEPDGKYGDETEQAIKDFQNEFNGYVDAGKINAKKLTPDGLFGPATLAAVKMVEKDKDVFAISRLNPDNYQIGTQVAGRGAAGLPSGGGKSGKKADKKDAVTIGPAVVSLENPTTSVFGGNVYVATVKTSDGKEFKGEHAQSGDDDRGDIELAKAQAIDKARAHIKSLTKEHKRGKTTMNKTRLINIIKEEIESVLSENRFETEPRISRDSEEIARLPGKEQYYDKIRAKNLAYFNQNKDTGRYKDYAEAGKGSLPDLSHTVPMSYREALEYIKGTREFKGREDKRASFWARIQRETGRLVIPDLVTGEFTGEKSVKGKVGQDRIAKQNLGKLPKDLPKQSSQALAQGIKGSVADPTVMAKIARNKKIQRRLTSPNTLRKIQRKLIQLRFLPAKIQNSRQDDGSYGQNTMQAIEKFQIWANRNKPGLEPGKVDGLAGRKTRAALRATKLEQVLTSQAAGKMRDAGQL